MSCFLVLYRGSSLWVFVYGAFSCSKRQFKLDSAVECIFCFLRLLIFLRVVHTFWLCAFISRSKSAINKQTNRRTSMMTQDDPPRMQEIRPVMSRHGLSGGRRRTWTRGRWPVLTVNFSASMSGRQLARVAEEDGRRACRKQEGIAATETDNLEAMGPGRCLCYHKRHL